MKLTYIIKSMSRIKNDMHSTNISHTDSYKSFPIHYGLRGNFFSILLYIFVRFKKCFEHFNRELLLSVIRIGEFSKFRKALKVLRIARLLFVKQVKRSNKCICIDI